MRVFPQTGFRIDEDSFWDYFRKRGGVDTFGYPVSQTSSLLGTRVQMFQRLIMQLRPDGRVGTLNLFDAGLLPFTHINGSNFPAPDPAFDNQIPPPSDANYLSTVIRFVQANAPDTFDGHQVNFGRRSLKLCRSARPSLTARLRDATTLLAGFDVEMLGPADHPDRPTIQATRTSSTSIFSAASCTTTPARLETAGPAGCYTSGDPACVCPPGRPLRAQDSQCHTQRLPPGFRGRQT